LTGQLGKRGKCTSPAAVVFNENQQNYGFDVTDNSVTIQCLSIIHPGNNYDGIDDSNGSDDLHIVNVIILDPDYAVDTYGGSSDGLWVKNSAIKGTDSYGIYVNSLSTGVVISGTLLQ